MPDAANYKLPKWRYISDANSDQDWSVADSVRPFDRYIAVNSTLDTAGTAEDLFNIDTVPEQAVNVYTNPSFEGTLAGWTADGAPATKVTTAARSGSNHLLLNPANSADDEGAYFSIDLPRSEDPHKMHVVVSCFVRGASASGDFIIHIQSSDGATTHASSAEYNLTTAYARQHVKFTLPSTGTGAATYRVWLGSKDQHNVNMYVDDLQVEVNYTANLTDYINTTTGEINCGWQGTANASPSQRLAGIAAIRAFSLKFDNDTYVAFDHTASTTTGTSYPSVLVKAGTQWDYELPLNVRSRISFVNVNTGETPVIFGSVWGRTSL